MGKLLIEYEQGDIYEQLVDEYEVFNYYYEVLVFLAVIGYREERKKHNNYKGKSEDATGSEASLQNVHSRDLFHTVGASLAFQDTGDPKALVEPEEHKRVIAQYAAGGLEVAQEEFGQNAGDPMDAIVNYIQSHRNDEKSEEIEGELGDIVDAFDDEMMGYE